MSAAPRPPGLRPGGAAEIERDLERLREGWRGLNAALEAPKGTAPKPEPVTDEETTEQQAEPIITAGDDRRDPVDRIMDIINEAALRLRERDLEHLHDRLRDCLGGLGGAA